MGSCSRDGEIDAVECRSENHQRVCEPGIPEPRAHRSSDDRRGRARLCIHIRSIQLSGRRVPIYKYFTDENFAQEFIRRGSMTYRSRTSSWA